MTAEQPRRPESSRAGALENLDAARDAYDTIAAAVGLRSRLTTAQLTEAGVGVLMVLVPVARGLVWAVLDVADAVREAAAPPPPDVRAVAEEIDAETIRRLTECPSRITVDDIRARCSGPVGHVGVVHFDFRLGQRWTTDEQDDLPW